MSNNRRISQIRLSDNAPSEVIKVYQDVVNIAHDVLIGEESEETYNRKHKIMVEFINMIPKFGTVDEKLIDLSSVPILDYDDGLGDLF